MTLPARPALRVGMIGHAFMGAAHSHAWRTAPRFFDLPLTPAAKRSPPADAPVLPDAPQTAPPNAQ